MEPSLLPALTTLLLRHAAEGVTTTSLPGVALYRAAHTTTPVPVVYEPMLCVIVQGAKQITLGGERYTYDPAHCLVVSLELPVTGEVVMASDDAPYLAFSLALDRAVLASLLLEFPQPAGADDAAVLGLEVTPMTTALGDACLRLLRLLDHPDDQAALAPLVQREILYRLLRGPQGSTLRQIASGDGRMAQVQDAIQWIRTHYDQPLRIEALATQVALSPSSLHRHFRAATRLSPLQYQKQLRLDAARQRLVVLAEDAASAAFAVGYESATQFNREFKRQFGYPPGEEARRWRQREVVV